MTGTFEAKYNAKYMRYKKQTPNKLYKSILQQG